MRKIILIAVLLALPLVCFGQDATTEATPKYEEQSLQLAIKSDKEVYKAGENIGLSVVFKNIGKNEISFCRYLLEYRLMKTGIGLKNKEGESCKVITRVLLEMPVITEEDFITLLTNEEYSLELQFPTVFALEPKLGLLGEKGEMEEIPIGTYQVSSVYDNPYDFSELPKKKIINAWTGTLTSNTITIEVAEKKE